MGNILRKRHQGSSLRIEHAVTKRDTRDAFKHNEVPSPGAETTSTNEYAPSVSAADTRIRKRSPGLACNQLAGSLQSGREFEDTERLISVSILISNVVPSTASQVPI
jgi:hypothetical protein